MSSCSFFSNSDLGVEMVEEGMQVSGLGGQKDKGISTEQECRRSGLFGMHSNAGDDFHSGRGSPAEGKECRPGVSLLGIESRFLCDLQVPYLHCANLLFHKVGQMRP